MKNEEIKVPDVFQEDIRRAVEILKAAGCTEIFLFGSLATERAGADSDLDLAIRGCPRGNFFHLLGQLMFELDHPVDLVDLDSPDPFARYLEEKGNLTRID